MKKISLVLFVLCTYCVGAQVSNYTFTKENGQLTEIDNYPDIVVTNHTVNDDEVIPATIAIGFPFMFNGTIYDSLSISENGFVWFGPASADVMNDVITPISGVFSSNVKGIVSAMGMDMHPHMNTGLTTTIKSGTTGTAPMRELIIEWKNTSRYEAVADALGEDTIMFQIKLYEFMNRIELAYGSLQLNPNIDNDVEVGLRGATATDFNSRKTDATHGWSNTLAGTQLAEVCELSTAMQPEYGLLLVWFDLGQHSTGINKPTEGVQVAVYPNPTSGKVFIEPTEKNWENITITNIAGQQLAQHNSLNNQNGFDFTNYPGGLYFYHITDYTGQVVANGKFMLAR